MISKQLQVMLQFIYKLVFSRALGLKTDVKNAIIYS